MKVLCCFIYSNFRFALNCMLFRNMDHERKYYSCYSWNNYRKLPWTFPLFFFIWTIKLEFFFIKESIVNYELKVKFLFENFELFFLPTLVGSIPITILVWLITYYLTNHYLVKRFDEKKNKTRG